LLLKVTYERETLGFIGSINFGQSPTWGQMVS